MKFEIKPQDVNNKSLQRAKEINLKKLREYKFAGLSKEDVIIFHKMSRRFVDENWDKI